MTTKNTKFPISMATAEVEEVVWKKLHGKWVKVKMLTPASSMNPITLDGKQYPSGKKGKS